MAKPKKYVLTEQERDFAEKNHNLIYSFLHKNRLEISEFYDSAVFGFLRAVATYHRKPGLKEKYEFYVIAWTAMRCDVHNEMDSRRRRATHEAYSLDAATEDGTPLSGFVKDVRDDFWQAEEEMELHRMLALFMEELTVRQRQQMIARLLGYKRKDIVMAQGISTSTYQTDSAAVRAVAAAGLEYLY